MRAVTASEIVSRVSSLLVVVFLTRALIPTHYGVYKAVFAFFSLLLVIKGLTSIEFILQKRLPQSPESEVRRILSTSLVLFFGLISLTVVLGVVAIGGGLTIHISPEFGEYTKGHIALIVAFLVAYASRQLGLTVLRSLQWFKRYSLLNVVRESSIVAALGTLFMLDSLTITTGLSVHLLVDIAIFAVILFTIRDYLTIEMDFHGLLEQLRQVAAPLVPRTVLKAIRGSVFEITLVAIFSAYIFGIWSVIFAFSSVFSLIGAPFSKTLLPDLSERAGRGGRIAPLVNRYYRFVTILTVPACVGGVILGNDIIRHVFGEMYVYDFRVVAFLLIALGLRTINTLSGYFFIATNKEVYESANQLIGVLVRFVGLAIAALWLKSLIIVAAAFFVEQLLMLISAAFYQIRTVDIAIPRIGTTTRFVLANGVLSLIVLVGKVHVTGISELILLIVGGALAYFITLLVTGFFSQKELGVLRTVIKS